MKASVTEEAVAERAYSLWEQAGRPSGRDAEFWYRAQESLKAGAQAPPAVNQPVAVPPRVSAALPHEVPPRIKDVVKAPGRLPSRQRLPKRA